MSLVRWLAIGVPPLLVLAGSLLAFGLAGNRRPADTLANGAPSGPDVQPAAKSVPPASPAVVVRSPKPPSPPLAVAPFDAAQAKAHQAAWSQYLGQPVEVTNSIGMKLILIPPGEFQMGSPAGEAERRDDELQHRVRLTKSFYLGVTEVTQEQYERVMGSNPSEFKGAQLPVENVSWDEAMEFCRKLSVKEGRVCRLPTEAEWEYACRAGTTSPFHFGSQLNGVDANCDGNYPYGTTSTGPYLKQTAAVGSYRGNGFGLYDMHGNVNERCSDWYSAGYSGSPTDDPSGAASGSDRVFRGGGWLYNAGYCRSACRSWLAPGRRSGNLGFRVASVLVDASGR